jgi:hypothetical protein
VERREETGVVPKPEAVSPFDSSQARAMQRISVDGRLCTRRDAMSHFSRVASMWIVRSWDMCRCYQGVT